MAHTLYRPPNPSAPTGLSIPTAVLPMDSAQYVWPMPELSYASLSNSQCMLEWTSEHLAAVRICADFPFTHQDSWVGREP